MDRRSLIKNTLLTGIGTSLLPNTGLLSAPPDKQVLPTKAQSDFLEMKFGMFIHFGINTFYDKEWSYGELDPVAYNPANLDTDEWCRLAKLAGAKYIVFVTKHIDGFCNWPTKFSDYSVVKTPFKKDLVKMVADSAARHGLKLGLYYALWDNKDKSYTDDLAYADYVKNQLTELLTNYGTVSQIWLDGMWKKQSSGWGKDAEGFINAWRSEGAYRWKIDYLYSYIKKLQPDCLVINNSTTDYKGVPLHPVDIRCGEKATDLTANREIWNFAGKEVYLPLQIETTLSQKGEKLFPNGCWFWHEWDHSVATREQVTEWKNKAAKLNANLVINVGPMSDGRLRPEDISLLKSLAE